MPGLSLSNHMSLTAMLMCPCDLSASCLSGCSCFSSKTTGFALLQVTLLGLWLFPAITCIFMHFWRFLLVPPLCSSLAAWLTYLGMREDTSQEREPRMMIRGGVDKVRDLRATRKGLTDSSMTEATSREPRELHASGD